MIDDKIICQLKAALEQNGYESYYEQFIDYLTLLIKWNKVYNLTAIKQPELIIHKHFIDSLAIAKWLKGKLILDVGTGAGFPGIPLAITHPDIDFILLDSLGKRINFLKEVKRQLNLNNVQLEQTRIENYHQEQGFDTVISRAFSSLKKMTESTKHLLNEQGFWLAMKGEYPEEELSEISYPFIVHAYEVPYIIGKRCCVLIKK